MPVTIAQLRATATVDLMTAAAALGLGRTKAYELARREQFPCRVIRIGEVYRVPTPGCWNCSASPPRTPHAALPALTTPRSPANARSQPKRRNGETDAHRRATAAARRARSRGTRVGAPKAWQRAELVIWGAHGGAGTTTLATWLQPAWDMGPARPPAHPRYPAKSPPAGPDRRLPDHGMVRPAGHQGGRRSGPGRAARSPCWRS